MAGGKHSENNPEASADTITEATAALYKFPERPYLNQITENEVNNPVNRNMAWNKVCDMEWNLIASEYGTYSQFQRSEAAMNRMPWKNFVVPPAKSFKLGEDVKVCVISYTDPSDFYVLRADSCLNRISDMLLETEQELALPMPGDLPPGTLCAAQCSASDPWFRAKVVFTRMKSVHLIFIDCGELATVHVNNVRCLTEEIASIPTQAVCCALFGIKPLEGQNTWSQQVRELLKNAFNKIGGPGELFYASVYVERCLLPPLNKKARCFLLLWPTPAESLFMSLNEYLHRSRLVDAYIPTHDQWHRRLPGLPKLEGQQDGDWPALSDTTDWSGICFPHPWCYSPPKPLFPAFHPAPRITFKAPCLDLPAPTPQQNSPPADHFPSSQAVNPGFAPIPFPQQNTSRMPQALPPSFQQNTSRMAKVLPPSFQQNTSRMAQALPPSFQQNTSWMAQGLPPSFQQNTSRMAQALPPSFQQNTSRMAQALPRSFQQNTSRMAQALHPSFQQNTSWMAQALPPSFQQNTSSMAQALPPSFQQNSSRMAQALPFSQQQWFRFGSLHPSERFFGQHSSQQPGQKNR